MDSTVFGFIGLGLIGGSLAKTIRRFHPSSTIYAYDTNETTILQAQKDRLIDVVCHENDLRFSLCDYLFLCAPVSYNISCLEQLKEMLRPSCIISDVGSVKHSIHQTVASLGLTKQFIGGHPMAGSEKTGYENASDHLLENAYYLLTPSDEVPLPKIGAYMELITSLGAIPLLLSPEEHDYITAGISHLPHIVAASLVNVIAQIDSADEPMKALAAGGFKDITRIASSSPIMWQQICLENKENISKVLDAYIRCIIQAKYLVDQGDGAALYALFSDAREYRSSMSTSTSGSLKKSYLLYCDIVDETGAIATIATLLAKQHISIKNIGLVHNREFEEGVLTMEFYDKHAKDKAAALLKQKKYILYER